MLFTHTLTYLTQSLNNIKKLFTIQIIIIFIIFIIFIKIKQL